MSKLTDYIRRATHQQPAPLGFAAAAPRAPSLSLLCLVRLSENEAGRAAEAASKGADGVIIERAEPRKLKDLAGKVDNLVLGVRPQRQARESISALRQAGADFAVIEPGEALAEALLEEKIGYVLTLDRDADDTRLRLLGDIGLEAVVVPTPAQPLTVERMLSLRRIAALTRTPLLVEVPPDADVSLLQVLRDSGVTGVMVNSSGIGKLEALRERIASLPRRGRRREEHVDATLPVQVHAHAGEDDEEEDRAGGQEPI